MAGKLISDLNSGTLSIDDAMEIDKDVSGTRTSFKTTVKDIVDFANLNLAEEYDSTSTYAVDDYVIYESVLYKCIGTTTGTFDSTKWTSVVVTDEMGSGGGGGTGGHTIIDENGNSMTARAGLQFVGGANVSDDSTNNKTIVDVASAGGIDGVFIDANNVIKSGTNFRSSLTYTATEDCAFCLYLVTQANVSAQVKIDGITIIDYWKSSMDTPSFPPIFLKKGQILSVLNANASYDSTYRVYGIQTGTMHSKFQPVIYSTEEREIGVWTDGKPLYQKTIILPTSMSITSNTWTDIDDGDWSFVGTFVLGLMVNNNGASVGFVAVDKNTSNNKLRILQTRNTDITCKSVTIQYTKSTDTAGSGSWTPQGVPTHHYSTDEQIVGTWNGETLYEKTYFNVSITNQANNLVESNFDSHRVLQNFNISTKGMANTLFNYSSSINDTLFIENGDLKYYVSKTGSWWNALDKVDITIQYTKSS